MKQAIDKHGNTIIHDSTTGLVQLQLKGETFKRTIGRYDPATRTFFVERDLKKHLHERMNALGFNYYLMSKGKFNRVVVNLNDGGTMETTRLAILERGAVKSFRQANVPQEVQIFLPLDQFMLRKKPRQLELLEKELDLEPINI